MTDETLIPKKKTKQRADFPLRQILTSSWVRYFGLLQVVFVLLFVVFVLVDSLIMPIYVGNKDVAQVPNIRNLPISIATERLETEGFSVVVNGYQYSATVAEDQVLIQQPFPYASVKPGRTVYLTVSKGNAKTTIPDLMGKSLRDARVALLRQGFEIGEITYSHDSLYAANTIAKQSIPPNTQSAEGTVINLVVSLGAEKELLIVPDLIGMYRVEAEEYLLEIGFTPGKIIFSRDGTFAPNTVFSQFPEAGESVETGTEITLYVSQ